MEGKGDPKLMRKSKNPRNSILLFSEENSRKARHESNNKRTLGRGEEQMQ